ncbi:MAG: tRNA-dihydrouridine synthase family protein [Planctomycetes bacterium]|nr:tRNA-dihydrouridine synthase family protein [Planctomycetota bacterium]
MTLSTPQPEQAAARAACLPFTSPWLLAPMDGVTEPVFLELVMSRNPAEHLGGAFTEFVRVTDHPVPTKRLAARLALPRFDAPVGLQLMGADLVALAETARNAEAAGAPILDLNFGCPAKGALRGCAGSATLTDPSRVEATVRACREAVSEIPVTAKMRAGFEDDALLEENVRAAEAGGAALVTVHCRTKAEQYCPELDWSRIARAVEAAEGPVCGNGGVKTHADLERMRSETGCELVMVGHGALADPWIFSGASVSPAEAARFLLEYSERLCAAGAPTKGSVQRIKQLLVHWTAGELCGDRSSWLKEPDPEALLSRLREVSRS